MRAVVLAGGQGRRLRPYTTVLPKPLMPLGDQPILEIVIRQLQQHGCDRITIAVGHLAGLIQAYFGDGRRWNVSIDYSIEDRPLGTAGPLSLIDPPEEDFLVMNGDVLTDLDLSQFVAAHRSGGSIATLATYEKTVELSLGVLDLTPDDQVVGYSEKPSLRYPVSTGIYCFRPDVLRYLETGERCDLPDLVLRLIAAEEQVRAFRLQGSWLDIGRPDDYRLAQELFGDEADT